MTETAATFIPISYRVFAFFSFSQFISRTVLPALIPKICVCTAPDMPTVHRSELDELIDGAIAEGGGDLTVVVDVAVLSTVEVFMLSVLITSSAASWPNDAVAIKIITTSKPSCLSILKSSNNLVYACIYTKVLLQF